MTLDNARPLDTYLADLLNESPPRTEAVTEIQTEQGELLCYAEPEKADRIAACWNACEGINPEAVPDLMEALRAIGRLADDGVIVRSGTGKPQWSLIDELKAITRLAISKAESK